MALDDDEPALNPFIKDGAYLDSPARGAGAESTLSGEHIFFLLTVQRGHSNIL